MSESPSSNPNTYHTPFGIDVTREFFDDAARQNAQAAILRAANVRLAVGPTGWSLRGEGHARLAQGIAATMQGAAKRDPDIPRGVGPVALPVKTAELDETFLFVASTPDTFADDAEYDEVCRQLAYATSASYAENGHDVQLPS